MSRGGGLSLTIQTDGGSEDFAPFPSSSGRGNGSGNGSGHGGASRRGGGAGQQGPQGGITASPSALNIAIQAEDDGTQPVQTEHRFPAARHWHDLFWGVTFLLHLALFVALIAVVEETPRSLRLALPAPKAGSPAAALTLAALVVERARSMYNALLASSAIGLGAGLLIWCTWGLSSETSISYIPTILVMTSSLMLISTLMLFIGGANAAGVAFIVITILQAVHMRWVLSRIVQTVQLLVPVLTAVKVYPATSRLIIVGLFAQAAYNAYWCYVASRSALMLRWEPIIVFLYLSSYWVSSVIKNWIHVSTCGPLSAWYLLGSARMPSMPTVAAMMRASFKDFGSVCLSALIVAPARFLAGLLDTPLMRLCSRGGFAPFVSFVREYISPFALAHQALYDKPLITAAKDARFAILLRKVDTLAKNDLLAFAAFHLSFSCGMLSCASALLWGYSSDLDEAIGILGLYAFATTYFALNLSFEPMIAGMYAGFVCFSEDPYSMQQANPMLFRKILTEVQGRRRKNRNLNLKSFFFFFFFTPPQNQ